MLRRVALNFLTLAKCHISVSIPMLVSVDVDHCSKNSACIIGYENVLSLSH